MKTTVFLTLIGFLLLMPAGCGGGAKDEGRATLRGVVVDGNPYTRNSDLGGHCAGGGGCRYTDPLPPTIANAEVYVSLSEGGLSGFVREAVRVRTDATGRFAVNVPPGLYQVSTDLSQEKRDAGSYCVSGGLLRLNKGDDKSMVVGNDLCRNFTFIVE